MHDRMCSWEVKLVHARMWRGVQGECKGACKGVRGSVQGSVREHGECEGMPSGKTSRANRGLNY